MKCLIPGVLAGDDGLLRVRRGSQHVQEKVQGAVKQEQTKVKRFIPGTMVSGDTDSST